eukprot:TRINITY_DN3515_c0_g1_i2.p1 TRINITY_DN3515_c0_g1~~TRINITY_DN3515_c0_g1_i2.p1  ORF type:complete len:391 (+),score=58.70 TRINITY_DN3515_c0_g1_i2:144-1316(+)
MADKKRRPPPTIDMKNLSIRDEKYTVTMSGTFREGDLELGKRGLLVKGESPHVAATGRKTEIGAKSPERAKAESLDLPLLRHEDGMAQLELSHLKFANELGKGSSGKVFKTVHEPTQKLLAVKVMPLVLEENFRKQMLLELKMLHTTQSPYIVSFFDAFYDEGSVYMAMEYLPGGSLQGVLERAHVVPESPLAIIASPVLQGLSYLHKQLHVIHRDIKPGNLLLSRTGHVKIADFGVSGQLDNTVAQAVSYIGTVTYMSPERISAQSYTYDSDIWSFGLSVFEAALGRFPYHGERASTGERIQAPAGQVDVQFWELVEAIVQKPAPVLNPSQFSAPPCDFVQCCLQKDPIDRKRADQLLQHAWMTQNVPSDSSAMEGELLKWLQPFLPKS